MKRAHIVGIAVAAGAAVVVLCCIGLTMLVRGFFYPPAPDMPGVVEQPIEEILTELEEVLKAKAPHVLEALQPGLSSEDIVRLEREGGLQLSDDIKALYMWHNGSRAPKSDWRSSLSESLIPGHRFLPLEEAVKQSLAWKKQIAKDATATQVFVGHRESWLTLFDDGCGDGYFYDTKRKEAEGAFFRHFAEEAYYLFFPSLRNLLAGVVKCVEHDAFVWRQGPKGPVLEEDFELSMKIWLEFGTSNTQ